MDMNIVLAGEAGQGLKTFSGLLGKGFFRAGFDVFSSKDYMSRVRGGHNFMQIRVGRGNFTAPVKPIDILVALNEEGLELHHSRVKNDGVIIYDGETGKEMTEKKLVNLPAAEIASGVNPRAENTVYMGALLEIMQLPAPPWEELLQNYFTDETIAEDNVLLLQKGKQAVDYKMDIDKSESREEVEENNDTQIFITGNDSLAMGAAVSGVQFYSGYPMTPSTGIMNYLANHQDRLDLAVEQAEDEIGAINMAIGASFAGIRAMTGTSGGGFALMNEGLGLAAVTEIPLVIAEVQRPGPATGLPTRTGQGDLQFVINSAQGEFPLKVIAPRNRQEAFTQTLRAFNLAEKYQIPVIILSDQFLADSAANIPEPDLSEFSKNRYLLDSHNWPENKDYCRYEFTDSEVSPRAYPGQLSDEVVLVDSHEHDECGFVTEDKELMKKIIAKRDRKRNRLREEDLLEPEYTGADKPQYLLVCWGSSHGPVFEAMEELNGEGYKIGLLSYTDVWPLSTELLSEIHDSVRKIVAVENNSTAQFARLITSECGLLFDDTILKADGRPFYPGEIKEQIERIL